jgi:hypothetical protein
MSLLLPAHKVLISAALALGVILLVWGVVHGVARREQAGWVALAIGAVAVPACALYLRKLYRNPPIR